MQRISTPPPPPLHPSHGDLSRGLRWSAVFHAGLALFVIIKSFVFPGTPIVYHPTLRVDIVGLPDLLKNEKQQIAKLPQAETTAQNETLTEALKQAETQAKKVKTPEPAMPDELVLKPTASNQTKQIAEQQNVRQKKMKNALDRIKALSRITEAENKASPGVLIKGNHISKGTSLSGDARESLTANYYDSLRERLQEFWSLPVWIARQKLAAQVQMMIDSRGRLQSFRFVRLSGNAQFDNAVKRTLQESQPYPTPPRELASTLMSDGILVGFPL
jgi:colicin import membrane protein